METQNYSSRGLCSRNERAVEQQTSDVFSLRAALIAKEIRGCADYNREKRHYRSHHRESPGVHPRSRNRSELLGPDGCKPQGVVRCRAARWRAGPRSKAT
jgi:hypothetical protein